MPTVSELIHLAALIVHRLRSNRFFNVFISFVVAIWEKTKDIFGADKRSMALFRVFLGITTLWDLGDRARDLTVHYTDEGLMPRSLILEVLWNEEWTSVYMMSGNFTTIALLFILNAVLALCLTIGYRTRLMCFLCYIFCCGIQDRNSFVGHSGDNLGRIALLYGVVLPLGECFSVDAALKARDEQAARPPTAKSLRASSQQVGGGASYVFCDVTSLIILVQMVIMYSAAYYHKTGAEWNQLGTATWLALQMDSLRRTPYGDWLLMMPRMCRFLTNAVHDWQLAGNYFFFFPVFTGPARLFAVIGYFVMHLGLGICLRLGQFSWITCIVPLAWLPPFFWDELVFGKWMKTKTKTNLTLYYDPDCKFCHTAVNMIQTFLLLPETRIMQLEGDVTFEYADLPQYDVKTHNGKGRPHTWLIVRDHNNAYRHDWDAACAIIQASPPIFPLIAWARRCGLAGNVLLNVIHTHTEPVDAAPGADVGDAKAVVKRYRSRPPVLRRPRAARKALGFATRWTAWACAQAFAAFLVYVCITWNRANFGGARPDYRVQPYIFMLHLTQNWNVFAPVPPSWYFWFMIEGQLDNGTKVELFSYGNFLIGQSVPWTGVGKPPQLDRAFKNHRWLKYWENGYLGWPYESQKFNMRMAFGKWLCRNYNRINEGTKRLWNWKIHFVGESAIKDDLNKLDGFNRRSTGSQVVWEHTCYDGTPSFQWRQ